MNWRAPLQTLPSTGIPRIFAVSAAIRLLASTNSLRVSQCSIHIHPSLRTKKLICTYFGPLPCLTTDAHKAHRLLMARQLFERAKVRQKLLSSNKHAHLQFTRIPFGSVNSVSFISHRRLKVIWKAQCMQSSKRITMTTVRNMRLSLTLGEARKMTPRVASQYS